ncbi:hypothetical protein BH20ACI1_BH20ACI1_19800 [soil metagenome]
MKNFHFSIFCLLLLVSSNFYAQANSKKQVKQCSELFARQLVEQQAYNSKSIEETDKRINVLLKIADFLWKTDEETSRRYFAEAFQVARERFREKGNEPLITGNIILRRIDYRFEVINAIAAHDAEWAKKLTETALKEAEENKDSKKEKDENDFSENDSEANNTRNIAVLLADKDPSASLYFARRAMRFPFSRKWGSTIFQIAEKNQTLADQIYSEVLNNYSNIIVSDLNTLSAYPFGKETTFGIANMFIFFNPPNNFVPNQNLQKHFLTTFFRRILILNAETANQIFDPYINIAESTQALSALAEIEPIVLQKFPEVKEQFGQAKNNIETLISGAERENLKKREDNREKGRGITFSDRIEELEKADDEGKLQDYMIVNLVIAAKKEEDFKQLETWLEKIKDENLRDGSIQHFYFKRSKLAVKEKRFDDAKKYADKVAKIELRAVLYFDVADAKIKEPTTKFDSFAVLSEVYKLADKSPDTVEKAQVFLGLAYIFEKVDHVNALDSLSNAIKTANKLETPNLISGYAYQQIASKEFGGYFMRYDVPGFDINKTFYELSQKDFQGALLQADSFSDKYLRTLAVLAIVKDCRDTNKPANQKTVKKQ